MAASKTDSHVTFSSVVASLATKTNKDATTAGKALRSRIRAMGDDALREVWPEFKASGKAVRDGNRYPTSMPRELAETLLTSRKPAQVNA